MSFPHKSFVFKAVLVTFLVAKTVCAQGPQIKVIQANNPGGSWQPGSYVTQLEVNPDGQKGVIYHHGVNARGLEFENVCSVVTPRGLASNSVVQDPDGTDVDVGRDEEPPRYLIVRRQKDGAAQQILAADYPRNGGAPVFLHGKSTTVVDITALLAGRKQPDIRQDCREIIAGANNVMLSKSLLKLSGQQ